MALSIRVERRWLLWCVAVLALAWLGIAVLDLVVRPRDLAGIGLAILPPLALLLVMAGLLTGTGRPVDLGETEARLAEATRTVTELQARLGEVDALLSSSTERTEQLVAAASREAGGLAASAAALETAAARVIAGGEDTRKFAEHFRDTLPEIAATVGNVDATLRAVSTDSGVQLRAVETMLAAVQARNREAAVQADTAIASMTGLLARIDEASTRNTTALSKRAYALDAAVDGVLERTAATVELIRDQVEARLESMRAGVEATGKQISFLGDDSTRLFNQRLEMLLRTSDAMKDQLAAHEAGADRLKAQIEANLQALEVRFGDVGAAGSAVTETLREAAAMHFAALDERVAAVRENGAAAVAEIAGRIDAMDESLGTAADARMAEFEMKLGRVNAAGTTAVDDIQTRIVAMDAAVRAAAAERLTAFETQLDDARVRGMSAVEDIGNRVRSLETILGDAAAAQADDAALRFAALRSSGTQAIDDIAALITSIDAEVHRAAETRLAAFEARLAELRTAGGAAVDEIGVRAEGIDAALRAAAAARADDVEQRFVAAAATGAAAVDDVGVRMTAMEAEVRTAADARLAEFEARLFELRAGGAAAVDEIGARVAGIEATLRETAAVRVAETEQRFAGLRETGAAVSADVSGRLAAIEASLAGLEAPLLASQAALQGLDGQSAALQLAVGGIETSLEDRLNGTRSAMAELESEAERLFEAVSRLRDSVAEGSALVGEAATAFAGERSEVARLAETLEVHFENARASLVEIQSGTAVAATAAAAELRGEFARLEGAADAAAGTMRRVLGGVVDDSIAALQVAATTHAEVAFGEPIRAQLQAIEGATARAGSAGKAVAERLALHMVNLVETISVVEQQVGEIDTRFAIRARDSLAARSARLVGQLNASLVDVARLMAMPVKDDDWAEYLKGDRGVFARAMAPQLDREASRRIARLFQHDPEFRAEAARYVETFETLIQRLLGDRDGESLAATMLSSDIGKIYVAIAEATDRLPPSRSIN